MVRKVAFFYNVEFCDLSYNKSRNRAWKILGAPHNYFQFLVLAVGRIKFAGSVFQAFWLFQLFPASSKFPKFSSLWFSFSSRHSCYSCSFSSFLASILTYHHRCGRASRYGLVMELCATGKIWKLWYARTNCQILVKLENKNLDYVSLKNKKRVNKIHSTSSV